MKAFGKMRKKLNNKGLSLVEVIIAVVVLAAVVVPTMRLFASAAGNNARSKEQQRAIAVAESAMESFKAYDIEALCLQFGQGSSSGTASFKGVSEDGNTTYAVTATNSVGTAISPILDSEDKLSSGVTNFRFFIQKAVEDGKYYDVEILVNKNTDKSVMVMDTVNSYTDAVVQMLESDTNSISTLVAAQAEADLATISNPSDMVTGGSLSVSNVTIDSLDRNIKLTASVDASGHTQIVQEIDYDYSLTYSYQYHSTAINGVKTVTGQNYSGTLSHEFDDITHATELVVFDNSATGGELKNIYLYYFPMYKELVGASSAKDIITIDCSGIPTSALDPINAHVIKQMATIPTDIQLEAYDSTYHVDLDNTGNVVLHNNLDKNLAPGASSSGSTVTANGFLAEEDLLTGTKENKGLLYNIEVKVYNTGETEVLATFSGTKNN